MNSELNVFKEGKPTTLLFFPYSFYSKASPNARKNIHLPRKHRVRNTKHVYDRQITEPGKGHVRNPGRDMRVLFFNLFRRLNMLFEQHDKVVIAT